MTQGLCALLPPPLLPPQTRTLLNVSEVFALLLSSSAVPMTPQQRLHQAEGTSFQAGVAFLSFS